MKSGRGALCRDEGREGAAAGPFESSSRSIDGSDAVIGRAGRYREFITNVGSTEVLRLAGPGLTVDHVIAEHQDDYRRCHADEVEAAAEKGWSYDPLGIVANSYDRSVWEGERILAVLIPDPAGDPRYLVTRFDRPAISPAPPRPGAMAEVPVDEAPEPAGLPAAAREVCRRLIDEYEDARLQCLDFVRDHPGEDDAGVKWSELLCERLGDVQTMLLKAILAWSPEVKPSRMHDVPRGYFPIRGVSYRGRLYLATHDFDDGTGKDMAPGAEPKDPGYTLLKVVALDAIVGVDEA
jgi:hypothetical protein